VRSSADEASRHLRKGHDEQPCRPDQLEAINEGARPGSIIGPSSPMKAQFEGSQRATSISLDLALVRQVEQAG
jgi:hypothetical protein